MKNKVTVSYDGKERVIAGETVIVAVTDGGSTDVAILPNGENDGEALFLTMSRLFLSFCRSQGYNTARERAWVSKAIREIAGNQVATSSEEG